MVCEKIVLFLQYTTGRTQQDSGRQGEPQLVMLKSGSDFRFEPELDRTERQVQVQVQGISEPEREVRFEVRSYFQLSERVRTRSNAEPICSFPL
jgi:hypothetical protein